MDHALPWLRHVDADDVGDQVVDFDDMDVESPTGDRLGEVEGFVVDSTSGRPYYIAVDSGGWFKSKLFLLPVGRAHLDSKRNVLVADLTRERVERFPGFDPDEFEGFDEQDIGRFNEETARACSVSGIASDSSTEPWSAAWDRPDFQRPDWWRSGDAPVLVDRVDPVSYEGEATAVRDAEASPHPGGRAQPGDVIGVETGGEQTHVGETSEDENTRRRDAEDEMAKRRN